MKGLIFLNTISAFDVAHDPKTSIVAPREHHRRVIGLRSDDFF